MPLIFGGNKRKGYTCIYFIQPAVPGQIKGNNRLVIMVQCSISYQIFIVSKWNIITDLYLPKQIHYN